MINGKAPYISDTVSKILNAIQVHASMIIGNLF